MTIPRWQPDSESWQGTRCIQVTLVIRCHYMSLSIINSQDILRDGQVKHVSLSFGTSWDTVLCLPKLKLRFFRRRCRCLSCYKKMPATWMLMNFGEWGPHQNHKQGRSRVTAALCKFRDHQSNTMSWLCGIPLDVFDICLGTNKTRLVYQSEFASFVRQHDCKSYKSSSSSPWLLLVFSHAPFAALRKIHRKLTNPHLASTSQSSGNQSYTISAQGSCSIGGFQLHNPPEPLWPLWPSDCRVRKPDNCLEENCLAKQFSSTAPEEVQCQNEVCQNTLTITNVHQRFTPERANLEPTASYQCLKSLSKIWNSNCMCKAVQSHTQINKTSK